MYANTYYRCWLFAVALGMSNAAPLMAQSPWARPDADPVELRQKAENFRIEAEARRAEAWQKAREKGWLTRHESEDGEVVELAELDSRGKPVYRVTDNLRAGRTSSTSQLFPGGASGLSLDGSGVKLGEWDGGVARTTHVELLGRVTPGDNAGLSDHGTHVAATMVGGGANPRARGMAPNAAFRSYDWNSDLFEMAGYAAEGMLLSNHSYAFVFGWRLQGTTWRWLGDTAISATEDYKFGLYRDFESNMDDLAYDYPYYLAVWSAGNSRNGGPAPGTPHEIWNGSAWVPSTAVRPRNGRQGGYDCLTGGGKVSKNVLTIGAVAGNLNGYQGPASVVMSSFSSWGPADDGRVKPDLVANGVGLFSAVADGDEAYAVYSGTSMAAPTTTGSLVLLQQHYARQHAGDYMRAATLKGLAIHTADEAGNHPGPDYRFGWGLLNTRRAAELIGLAANGEGIVTEQVLAEGGSYDTTFTASGQQPLVVTLCWTDPAAAPLDGLLNPDTKMLVHDLDVRLIGPDSTVFLPYRLDRDNLTAPAQQADNDLDNVEKIWVELPTPGTYTIRVTHKDSLTTATQNFSLIVGEEFSYEFDNEIYAGVSPVEYCTAQPVTYPYLSYGEFPAGTFFRVELSDSADNFANPVVLDSVLAFGNNPSGVFLLDLPDSLGAGTHLLRITVPGTDWQSPPAQVRLIGASGGDAFDDALPVDFWPFIAEGSTTDCFTDQVGNSSPDVFYELTVPTGRNAIDITLCESSFNTVLRVFDADRNQIATNNNSCGTRSRLLDLPVEPGATYYVVVEGHISLSGDYVLEITDKTITSTNLATQSANWRVYPNPARATLHVSGWEGANAVLSLRDVLGRTVHTQTLGSEETVLQVGQLTAGWYVLSVRTDRGLYTERVRIGQ